MQKWNITLKWAKIVTLFVYVFSVPIKNRFKENNQSKSLDQKDFINVLFRVLVVNFNNLIPGEYFTSNHPFSTYAKMTPVGGK